MPSRARGRPPTRAGGRTRPSRDRLVALASRSVAIIEDGQDPGGAYVASPTFAAYRYCWLRDGAFIADAMSRAGRIGSAEAFFSWCTGVLEARRERIANLCARGERGEEIPEADFLPTRYHLDGREGSDDWANFQLDGYGAWVWALDAHCRRHGRAHGPWQAGALLSARYIAAFWSHPSYDWWEEHGDRTHASTLAAICGGLEAAARIAGAEPDRSSFAATAEEIRAVVRRDAAARGYVGKWLGDDAVDASLIALATPFRLLEPADPLMRATVARVKADLLRDGGVHRYLADTYYGGGQWLLLAGLVGWHDLETGRIDEAWRELAWIASRANAVGELPEQTPTHLLAPDQRDEWLARWGPVASPLLWSHALLLTLALGLGAVEAPISP